MAIKAKSKKPHRKSKRIIVVVSCIFLVLILALFYLLPSKKDPVRPKADTAMSTDLIRANELTKEVFRYVELVETQQMTQEEANRLSNPVKVELQNVRSLLSREELIVNDSIRKVMGNIMVENVMQWRKENLPPVQENE